MAKNLYQKKKKFPMQSLKCLGIPPPSTEEKLQYGIDKNVCPNEPVSEYLGFFYSRSTVSAMKSVLFCFLLQPILSCVRKPCIYLSIYLYFLFYKYTLKNIGSAFSFFFLSKKQNKNPRNDPVTQDLSGTQQ